MYSSLQKSNTATGENPYPNDSAAIVGLLKFWRQKIPKLFLHKCKAGHFKKLFTTRQNNLDNITLSQKNRGNIRSSEKKQKSESIYNFFFHMNDYATDIPLNLSITNRLASSRESQKAEQEYNRSDGIYLTRSTIDPATSLAQEKKLKKLKRHLPQDFVNMGWCSHTAQRYMRLQKFTLSHESIRIHPKL